MDEISLHIEYLLHKHDCVIVPGLGGFVINIFDVERNGIWGLDAPNCELIFNNKLTYNDGLLAESLMRTEEISYEAAIEKIDLACGELKQRLIKGEQVEWINLGTFKGLSEVNGSKRPLFSPNKSYIRPQYYGLTNVRLKPAISLSTKDANDKNAIPVKPFIKYISSGIAIALLFFFIVVSYNSYEPKSQHAEMVSNSLIFNKGESKSRIKNAPSQLIDEQRDNAKNAELNSIAPTLEQNSSISQSAYYVVVGVYEVRDVAEKTLSTLKKQGFTNASMLKRSGRLDVYSASFTDKKEAQNYLKKFHAENPKYHDAWLLKYN